MGRSGFGYIFFFPSFFFSFFSISKVCLETMIYKRVNLVEESGKGIVIAEYALYERFLIYPKLIK